MAKFYSPVNMLYGKVAVFCKLWRETMYFFKFLENLNSFHIIIHINVILSVLKNIKQVHFFSAPNICSGKNLVARTLALKLMSL